MNESERFDQNPEVVGGARAFKKTPVPVNVLFENLAAGVSPDEILDTYPSIGRERAELAIRVARRDLRAEAA